MLNNLPAELLLNILSFLDNLDPLSSSNRVLSTAVRDYQASQLRGRLARIHHADLLMRVWTPPSFFLRRDIRSRRTVHPVYASRPQDLINVLCDPEMIPRIEAYICSLERKCWVARKVAGHLVSLVNFAGFRNNEDRMSYATTLVIQLWTTEQRFAHDVDGYIEGLCEDYGFRDLCARDQYFLDQSADTQGWLIACYNALSQNLRPPFVPRSRRGEGMWLQRLITRNGMETVLNMLEQRCGTRDRC